MFPCQVNFFIGAFYDGVYLLGIVLNETISDGEDIRNGLAITKRMWSRDFHGKYILGPRSSVVLFTLAVPKH